MSRDIEKDLNDAYGTIAERDAEIKRLKDELDRYKDYRASLVAEGRFNALYELDAALGFKP